MFGFRGPRGRRVLEGGKRQEYPAPTRRTLVLLFFLVFCVILVIVLFLAHLASDVEGMCSSLFPLKSPEL